MKSGTGCFGGVAFWSTWMPTAVYILGGVVVVVWFAHGGAKGFDDDDA